MDDSKYIFKLAQRYALYLFFFSVNFEVWDPFDTDGFFSISKLIGFIYVMTMIPQLKYFKKSDTKNPFLLSILAFFITLTLISLVNINYISYSFFDFTVLQNIILFWLLLIHERNDNFVLEKGMLSFALGSATLALLFYAGVGIEYVGGRVRIFGDNQNIIGLRMSISIAIFVLAIAQNRLRIGRFRHLFLLPVPIMFYLMVETGSRVAFISFTFIFVSGVILIRSRSVIRKIFAFSMGAIMFVVLWIYFIQSDILIQRLLMSSEEGNLAGREIIWQRLIPLIADNPVFGVGRTGYAYFVNINNFGDVTSPHNVFIEVLCYTGIVGMIFYSIFLYKIFKRSFQKYRNEGSLLPLLLMVPVMGMLVSGQILGVKIGWVIFAYVAGSSVFITESEKIVGINPFIPHENSLRHR